MNKVTNEINNFFKKDFKKKFILFISLPFLLSLLFLVDFFLLPEFNKTDKISHIGAITISQSAGGTSMRTERKAGYNYKTEGNYKFSTLKNRIKNLEVKMKISPLFKTVKSVEVQNKKIKLASGFNGINMLILVLCNIAILISLCYLFLVKTITENARLNLIFLHILLFSVWIYIYFRY